MRYSALIHLVSIIAGIIGFLALIGSWIAGQNGTWLGFTQEHCINNAIVFTLISISAGVCAIYRRQTEQVSR